MVDGTVASHFLEVIINSDSPPVRNPNVDRENVSGLKNTVVKETIHKMKKIVDVDVNSIENDKEKNEAVKPTDGGEEKIV